MLDPEHVVDAATSRIRNSSGKGLLVLWVSILSDRHRFAGTVRSILGSEPVVPLVVRERGFDNPNALLSDLADLIRGNREDICSRLSAIPPADKPCLLLVARAPLAVAQSASPFDLPDWFPVLGGTTVYTTIEDLTWTADAPLNSPEANVERLSESLFSLEFSLIERLQTVVTGDHGASNQLLALLRAEVGADLSFRDFLQAATSCRMAVSSPSGFRPSVREKKSLIALLWSMSMRATDDGTSRVCQALSSALNLQGLPVVEMHESMTAVLHRPTSRSGDRCERCARAILFAVASACQLVTAAAHSDDYRRYPIQLIRSVSYDLRRSLSDAENLLR